MELRTSRLSLNCQKVVFYHFSAVCSGEDSVYVSGSGPVLSALDPSDLWPIKITKGFNK